MKAMGIVPKTLPEVLLEKKYVTAEQLREAGISVRATAGPARPARRSVIPQRTRSLAPWFALVGVVGVVALLLFFGGDILKAFHSPRGNTATKAVEPTGPTEAEKADLVAKEALDRVAEFQRTANDFENADEVVKRY